MTAASQTIVPELEPAPMPAPGSVLMCVDKLSVTFGHGEHATRAVRDVSFDLRAGAGHPRAGAGSCRNGGRHR